MSLNDSLNAKAQLLLDLHRGPILVLPTAWDAASAAVIASAGAKAIATTSGGVSWALGAADGQRLTREEMLGAVARVARAVDVPVTADVEAGYGDVAATVRGVIDAGAVGVNLEDTRPGTGIVSPAEQAAFLADARAAAIAGGVPRLVINARCDVYLFQIGEPSSRFGDVLERAAAYAEAGADVLFVPGLLDVAVLERLVKESPLPISVLGKPGGPSVAELAATGVCRVSYGTGLAELAYTSALKVAQQVLSAGSYEAEVLEYGEINALFRR
jgi:2-methylisocitrate lyase-like PEP mutase family enzyme